MLFSSLEYMQKFYQGKDMIQKWKVGTGHQMETTKIYVGYEKNDPSNFVSIHFLIAVF